jgi:hypothetical protein
VVVGDANSKSPAVISSELRAAKHDAGTARYGWRQAVVLMPGPIRRGVCRRDGAVADLGSIVCRRRARFDETVAERHTHLRGGTATVRSPDAVASTL